MSIAREAKLSRRSFLATAATATAALAAAPLHAAQPARRKTIALIGTEVRTHSHAQHFLDRFLLGYTWGRLAKARRRSRLALHRSISGRRPRARHGEAFQRPDLPDDCGGAHARHGQARGRWCRHHR
ncbi:MAG: twin-arginine translocation signal domain-containing protein [Verrucomicrobia bacterium]|nr:twin-arginine translocation signal domain-containing protein [Verrucomicrobiota bacterium]